MTTTPLFPSAPSAQSCDLCATLGGRLIWREADWRLVHVDDPAFPAFYRLIHEAHVAEFSQLSPDARWRCMGLLSWVEGLLIQHVRPTKVNLASLGNVVPHLHWHVIGRFDWDSHFPNPIWASAKRAVDPSRVQSLRGALPALDAVLAAGPGQ